MLTIKVFPLGVLEMNTYILHTDTIAVLIDVGENPNPVLEYLTSNNLTLEAIYLTHLHFDHIFGVVDVLQEYPVPVYANEEDMYLLKATLLNPVLYGLPPLNTNFTITPIAEGSGNILGEDVYFFHTPGHTKGSICYYFPAMHTLFSGDVLFKHTIGRTDLPGGEYTQLVDSIAKKLFTLPDVTRVYPGHGESTTIAHEKEYNPAIEELE